MVLMFIVHEQSSSAADVWCLCCRGFQSSERGRNSQQPDRRSKASGRNRATDYGNSVAGSRDRTLGLRENTNSPRDSMNSPRDSMNSRRDQRVRGTDQNRTVPNEASQSQGRYIPSRSAPRGNAADVAGSMPDGGNSFGGARSAGNNTFGANQTDFADPELSGGDQWEPTGSGRKAWYNPQSSSPSDAPGEELPSEALSKPKMSSHRPQGLQAMSVDAKRTLQRKTAAFRDSLRSTQGPAAPSGDQQLPVGDQQLPSGDQEMEWGSWQKGAPGSAAAGQQQEEEEGRENGRDRLLPGYQASKPVAQGRAKTIKLRCAASNISSHSIPSSLGCGASCDSSHILA